MLSLVLLIVVAATSYFIRNSYDKADLQSNSETEVFSKKEKIEKNFIQNNEAEEAITLQSFEKEIATEKSLAALDAKKDSNLGVDLVEIFGVGNPIPMDREAIERLMSKLSSDQERADREAYLNAEYDPAYDATWQTDVQIKAIESLNEHFPDSGAYIDKYECTDGNCSLNISLSDSEASLSPSEFMKAIRHSPSILNSGARRNIGISEIGINENGEKFVNFIVGDFSQKDKTSG